MPARSAVAQHKYFTISPSAGASYKLRILLKEVRLTCPTRCAWPNVGDRLRDYGWVDGYLLQDFIGGGVSAERYGDPPTSLYAAQVVTEAFLIGTTSLIWAASGTLDSETSLY